jgi:hypothetical protein
VTTFSQAVSKLGSQKHVLFEVEPKEEIWNWTATGGLSNTYEVSWSHITQPSISGGLYRRIISVEEEGAALTKRDNTTDVDNNAGSWYYDDSVQKIYVHSTGSVDPDTLDMMAAVFRLHCSTTGRTLDVKPAGHDATDLSGSGDYFDRGADLTGAEDGTKFTISGWVRIDGGNATIRTLFESAGQYVRIRLNSSNQFHCQVKSRPLFRDRISFEVRSSAYTSGADWYHLYIQGDCSKAEPDAHFYINNVDDKTELTLHQDTLKFTAVDWFLGDRTATGAEWDGAISEFWFDTRLVDRSKFINSLNEPVWLGENGEVPSGTSPLFYVPDGDPTDNKGTGGNFSSNGTPAAIDGPQAALPVHFEKRILASSSASTSDKASDLVIGTQRTSSGNIALDNHDGLFDIPAHDWSWKNIKARYLLGLDDLSYGYYVTTRELVIDDIVPGEEEFGPASLLLMTSFRARKNSE